MKPHRIRPLPAWGLMGQCPVCEQPAGKQCLDLRYAGRETPRYSDFAHVGRRKK